MPSAYLLVSHGSRDPRPQFAMNHLAALISQFPPHLPRQVGTAYLELSSVPLHEQIKEFGVASGYNHLQVVPLFLLPGVHVMQDIPMEVMIAQQALGRELKINLRPHLGTHSGLSSLLITQQAATESNRSSADLSKGNLRKLEAACLQTSESKIDAWILLAHGSRRGGSKQPVEAMATQLRAVSAYWAVPPKLELRVQELVSAGHKQIGILPYFLFAGGITDAIFQMVEELKLQFPTTNLLLAEPLGASAALADLIWDLTEK